MSNTEVIEGPSQGSASSALGRAKIAYLCMMAAPFLAFTGLIAVVLAYGLRAGEDRMIRSHASYIITTFWMWLGAAALAFFLWPTRLAWLVTAIALVAVVIRCAKGLAALSANKRAPVTLF